MGEQQTLKSMTLVITSHLYMKRCTVCHEDKQEDQFNKNRRRLDGLQNKCRDCSRVLSREYYSKHKQRQIAQISSCKKKRITEVHNYLLDYFKTHHCVDCGESDRRCLEFDHIRDKRNCVARLVGLGFGLKTIKKEIAKCEVRCANCHRKKTAEEQHWFTAFGS